jgi:hypothetical protein
MFGLFKLKKKSKKEKNEKSSQDDEKENKKSNKKSASDTKNSSSDTSKDSNIKIEKQQTIEIQIVNTNKSPERSTTLPATPSIPRNSRPPVNNKPGLSVEVNHLENGSQQPSPLSTATTTLNIQGHRAPMLSTSEAHTNSFVRGNFLSSTISGSDLHRFLNSGYMNGDPYLQRGVELKSPKSPHFHRPPNFSYSRCGPNYVTSRNRHTSASRVSASPRYSRNTLNGMIRNRSSSPASFLQQSQVGNDETTETVEKINREDGGITTITTTRIHKAAHEPRDLDTEEPIRLAKYPGAHQPDPDEEPIIESRDWPSPPYPAAIPELRARSRSSSNRRAPSTINSVHATHISVNGDNDSDDEGTDFHDEEVQSVLINNSCMGHDILGNRRSGTGATSVSSSLARVKASRPNSKLHYQNNLFDNDYNDYLLQYRADKDWKKMLNKSSLQRGTVGTNSSLGESLNADDLNNNSGSGLVDVLDDDEKEMWKEMSGKHELNDSKSEEVKKIKKESGMAAELLADAEHQQKLMIARKLKVDPWKASRTPNAKAEPSVRTRYESPVNASPSRVHNYHNSNRSTMTSATSGHTLTLTPVPGQSQTTSTTFIGDIALVNSTPITPSNQQYMHQYHPNNYKDVIMLSSVNPLVNPLTPNSINSLNRNVHCNNNINNNSNNNQYNVSSSSRILSSSCLPKAVPRPGYGLSSPNKSITLPNSARYVGLSTPRNYDFDSPYFSQPRDITS